MRYFLTTAIDYVNNRPHLGTAYEKVTADVIARFRRLTGADTHFLMGNDEHSQNVYKRAAEQGLDPLAYCDQMEAVFRDVWTRLDVSFDDFIRTTDRRRHRPAVQKMVRACHDAGDIYEGFYEGWYCVGCEAFKQEKELVDGQCPIHLTTPEWIREKNWFFRLSRYQQRLLDHYAAFPHFIEPEVRRNEILRLVESGLDDISVSRAGQAWGIELPFDPSSVVYVWFDALINYAAAVGYGWDEEQFAQRWPANLHIVGKDITRFHCVIWPAMLMSAGLPLPGQVFGHGWVFFRGERMSKSLGNIVDPLDAAERFGPDPLRLYLGKEVPFGSDGDFSWERFEEKYNADLANNLGNLVSRISAMADRYLGGRLPATASHHHRLPAAAAEAIERYRPAMEQHAIHDGAAAAFSLISATNLYIAETQPWTLAKSEQRDTLHAVLGDCAEALRVATVLLSPFIPGSAREILRRLGEHGNANALRLDRDAAWRSVSRDLVNGPPLWPRIDAAAPIAAVKETVRMETNESAGTDRTGPAANAGASQAGPAPAAATPSAADSSTPPVPSAPAPALTQAANPGTTPQITIDEFMKVELRVARVLEAERVPKSKKLIKLSIDLGSEQRTIVAGIAEAYAPDALVGRSVVIAANLQPATLMGIESNGMVLAASPEGGAPILLNAEPAAPGTRVR